MPCPIFRIPLYTALACLLVLAPAAHAGEEGAFRGDAFNRTVARGRSFGVELSELERLYGGYEWEIVPCFTHKDGHLGTYKVGQSIPLTISVGPIGMRTYARSKNFARNTPIPIIEVLKDGRPDGEVTERVRFTAGAC